MELGCDEHDSDISKGKLRIYRCPAGNEPLSLKVGADRLTLDRAINRGIERIDESLGTGDNSASGVDDRSALFLCRSERRARSAGGGRDEDAAQRDGPEVLLQQRYKLDVPIEHRCVSSPQRELSTRSNGGGRWRIPPGGQG